MKWVQNLISEINANKTFKSKLIIFLFRTSSIFFSKKSNPLKYFFIVFVVLYYIVVEFCFGVEIKPRTKIGWGLVIFHPTGIIINANAVLGDKIILRHGVTIGNKFDRKASIESKCPVIGDYVEFGAHACVIGDIKIGQGSLIGATAYVDFNVDCNTIVAANRGIILDKR